jgi:KRAB domain-containing zinc finger protein
MENSSKKIKLESENDFENSSESQQENFSTDQKVKKDPEGNFLFLPFESPKMPKLIKREVTRKEIFYNGPKSTKFSKFQCKICQKYFCNKKELNRHVELHFQPSSFECKKCEKILKLKGNFDVHKCAKKSERHQCSFCEKNYSFAISLSKHIKNCHAQKLRINWFYCDFCDEIFIQKHKLKFHLESFQCKKIFTCDHCGKEFHDKRKIWSHIKSHAVHKVECKICHVKVKEGCLNSHIKSFHHKSQIQCKFCDQIFPTKGRLNQHMKFHENPEQFKCQICGHQSKRKEHLEVHLKTHDKNREKNFKCNQCDYKTDHKGSLKKHLGRHSLINN